MDLAKTVLLINFASTLFMAGVIWIVQIVHYPLFAKVGATDYTAYQKSHEILITYVVLPPMTIELITALILVFYRPFAAPGWIVWTGAVLVLVAWLSTAFLQVPCHNRLRESFDADAHRFLVNSNWVRTVAWSVRAIVIGYLISICWKETA